MNPAETAPTASDSTQLLQRLATSLSALTLAHNNPLLGDFDWPERAKQLLDETAIANLTRAAVLIPVRNLAQGPSVLFTQRSSGLPRHAGQISFPGGKAEATDSSPVHTALRETQEEIGLDPDRVEPLGLLDDYPIISGYRVTPVVGLVEPDATFAPDNREVEEIFDVPLAFLLDADNYREHYIHRQGMDLPYFSIPWENHDIWGATAGMLHQLMCRMSNHQPADSGG